jgi:hypothetical protein
MPDGHLGRDVEISDPISQACFTNVLKDSGPSICGSALQTLEQIELTLSQNFLESFSGWLVCSASWNAFTDVEAFVDAVLTELTAIAADGTRPMRPGPKPPLTGAALRKAIMVHLFLRDAVARDRAAVWHPVRHAVRAVFLLDPARAVALAA